MAEKEYIAKEFVIDAIEELKTKPMPKALLFDHLTKLIEIFPTENLAPVKHGRWVKEKRDVLIHWHCSACRECYFLDVPNAKYCPHCGCKMDMDGGEGE